jgi:two-component system response regulator AtoC
MTVERILILDDELIIRKALEEQLRRKRLSVCSVSTLKEAQDHLAKDEFDLLFVDVHLPDGEGTELLDRIAEMPDPPLVVIITGNGTVESAVECMRSGAFDYIIKPFSSSQIDVLMKKAKDYRQLVKVNQFFTQESAVGAELIGKSEPIQNLRSMVSKVAPTEATVLINGENGTGKELVASELYRLSARKNAPFIKVNCAAISETLIESEFFGHEKGAFTGAMQRREGRFELADGGTILLDEISEISPKVQAKLLRVLQEREFERVGGNKTIKVDVRVIATTNRNLFQFMKKGEFREDLYYRLNVFPLFVPPLRERGGDVVLLAKSFAQRFSRKHGIKLAGFEDEATRALLAHDWPGNVRELQNTIERAVILTEPGSKISVFSLGLMPRAMQTRADLAPVRVADLAMVGAGSSSNGFSGPEFPSFSDSDDDEGYRDEPVKAEQPLFAEEEPLPLEQIERQHILRTLESTDGNKTQASNILGISIRTLRNKLSSYRSEGEFIPGEES